MGMKGREFGVGARIFDTKVTENGVEFTARKAKDRGVRLGFSLCRVAATVTARGIF